MIFILKILPDFKTLSSSFLEVNLDILLNTFYVFARKSDSGYFNFNLLGFSWQLSSQVTWNVTLRFTRSEPLTELLDKQ